MDKSRADFEAWAVSLGALLGIGPPDLSVDARGFYNDRDMVTGLACWQASRKQALREARTACEKLGDHEQDMGREKEAFGCDICCDAIRSLEGNAKESS